MRTQFVEVDTRKTNWQEIAQAACPWAAVIIKVFCGAACFESPQDAETWENQK